MSGLSSLRSAIRRLARADERETLTALQEAAALDPAIRKRATRRAISLVEAIRASGSPGLMEVFLAEYGLSTDEGIALMCLAEALLRVPDPKTIDDLIEDKIAPSSWGEHLGGSSSSLVNASTWALLLSGKLLQGPQGSGMVETLRAVVRRLGEPVIRVAVQRIMREMGHQFVLGRTIEEAIDRGRDARQRGYTFSYDMLGEAALTAKDATTFFHAYCDAIRKLAAHAASDQVDANPGISIKLSALHPRYEASQKARVMEELVPRVRELAILAKDANMGLNIDAEEADRLDLSLDVIEAVFRSKELEGWDGFGVVVQAFGKRAPAVIDWLHALAEELDRKIMIRLVKGAYWDTEIKAAQVDGVSDFPVFTNKAATDVSYICCAHKLLRMTERIYPQFATHNAHTISAILELTAEGVPFEFQRLHGMGESLHNLVLEKERVRSRIYAPVGSHRDLLAYLVRRLLENGANSSFVNQIVDVEVPAEIVAADPFDQIDGDRDLNAGRIVRPANLFQPERKNSKGWDLRNTDDITEFDDARTAVKDKVWAVGPIIAGDASPCDAIETVNPARHEDITGLITNASEADVEAALTAARDWTDCTPDRRAEILNKTADLCEANSGEIFAALAREAGKTPVDAVAEMREAVDFLRYYAAQADYREAAEPRGVIACISPWNFPLAIFTGQIAAALAVGNGVLAKPAEQTPIIAAISTKLLHQAGVPKEALQLLPGTGAAVGAKLTSDARVNGVCFTGSTTTAQTINRAMAENLAPDAMFIAETGGINAMIVDSTALPEQAVKDIVASAFQSAGQRCSALRMLYLQKDIADAFLEMLFGAMDQLSLDDPWLFSTDVGPAITAPAQAEITAYIDRAEAEGRLLKRLKTPEDGFYVSPAVISVDGIASVEKEIFGPVLHVATFDPGEIDQVIDDINASGFGLTFGLHTRIDDRVEKITRRIKAGNIYINRNQIGAIVGSQPFGGEGLSGTGPKAGGPTYLPRFLKQALPENSPVTGKAAGLEKVAALLRENADKQPAPLSVRDMRGPTGESNRLSLFPRGTILCLGPTLEDAREQSRIAESAGCQTVIVAPGAEGPNEIDGVLAREDLSRLPGLDGVALWSDREDLSAARSALANRGGAIVPLMMSKDMYDRCVLERHVCIDTTAAGGNASLLAGE